MGSRKLSGALALALLLASFAFAQNWVREYQQKIKSQSSSDRREAVEAIDPDSRYAVKLYLDVLAEKDTARVDWYQREAAIRGLGRVEDKKALKTLEKLLDRLVKRNREPVLLASLIDATSEIGDERFVEHYEAALEPKARHPALVTRSVVRAFGQLRELRFVEPILEAWQANELDYRLALVSREALKAITEQDYGFDVERWQDFWKAEGEGYVRPSERPDDEGDTTVEAAPEEEKRRITTVTRDFALSFTTTGRGVQPLLVIHDDTWRPDYFDPYLSCIGDLFKIYYVELPTISQLVEIYKDKPDKIKRNIGGFPYYPYDALCDAFDEARRKEGHEDFAVMAHGFSTMVAQRYLSKYGENVTMAIFVGTFPNDDAYGDVLDKLRAKNAKDKEIVHAVDYHYITDEKTFTRFYDPKDDRELAALERKWFTMMFANPQDPAISEIWQRAMAPTNTSLKAAEQEQCQSPPYDVAREKHPACPVLVISGKKSVWFGENEGERVAQNYPKSRHVVLENAANMPWFDDPAGFQKAVRDFVRDFRGK